jgi:hypothetical protein
LEVSAVLTSRIVALASALALLATPLAVAAPAVAEPTVATQVSIDVDSPVTFGDSLTVAGQVTYVDPEDGQQYGLGGATVVLERRYLDSDEWTEVGTQVTAGFWPDYEFDVVARKGARYRVSYAGDETYLPSSAEATVRVRRIVTSKVTEPSDNVFYLQGKVSPSYAGKQVALLRKKCSSCSWKVIKTMDATAKSTYKFRLPLPSSGTHYFRARVPADVLFLKSVSDVWEIFRIL